MTRNDPLQIGDVVQLPSMDFPMTVIRIHTTNTYDEVIECAWIDQTMTMHRERFNPDALEFLRHKKARP